MAPSERPAEAKFSPGQVVWATTMLEAVMNTRVLAGDGYEGADCEFLVQAVMNGALEVEKDHVVEMGMDGHARDENMAKFDALLAKCLEKEVVVEEVLVEESESSEEEMSDAEEVVEEIVEEMSDAEEEQAPVTAAQEDSSSSDEDFSSEEED